MGISRIAHGAYADVLDMKDGTVVKAYRRQTFTTRPVEDWRDHDAITRAFFEAETKTYERIQRHTELALFTPEFHGRIDPCGLQDLIDAPELGYVRNCGIRLERIAGEDIKVAHLEPLMQAEVERVLWRLRDEVAAGNVWDASCFIPGSRERFTLIDFATLNMFVDCLEQLERDGRFSNQQMEQWGLRHEAS